MSPAKLFPLALLAFACGAQAQWPDFMPGLEPALSRSPVAAVLPDDVRIEPPAANVAPERARWSGRWTGWACRNFACDTKLAVEKVTAEGASILYALASEARKPVAVRAQARFVGDELRAELPGGLALAYRMRPSGEIEFLMRSGEQWLAGLLENEASRSRAALAGAVVEQTWFTMTEKRIIGDRPLRMEATIYRPKGNGPFPAIVFSHGSTGGVIPPSQTSRPDAFANVMVANGFAVVAPNRRGRGRSEGIYDEPYGCIVNHGLERAMEDLEAAIGFAKSLPYVDRERMVVAGASRGGLLSVVYAARKNDPAIRAVLNFVGGWNFESCMVNDDLFRSHRTPVPSLWLYGDSDTYYTASAARRYAEVSGNAEIRLYRSGHALSSAPALWREDALVYLRSAGLPGAEIKTPK